MTDRDALREQLADYAHRAWSGWMEYMFKHCYRNGGSLVIPEDLFLRWTRQLNTDYTRLPFHEQESDRYEADKILAIVDEALRAAVAAAGEEEE